MDTTAAPVPVIIIQTMGSDLCALETSSGLSVEKFDDIDYETLENIAGKLTLTSVMVIESDAFRSCGISLHRYIREVRRVHRRSSRILILRCKRLGRDNPVLTEGDKEAGADEVLWYQLSESAKDISSRVNAFIRNGATSKPDERAKIISGKIVEPAVIKTPMKSGRAKKPKSTPLPARHKKSVLRARPPNTLPAWLSGQASFPRGDAPLEDDEEGDTASTTIEEPGTPKMSAPKARSIPITPEEKSLLEQLLRRFMSQNGELIPKNDQLIALLEILRGRQQEIPLVNPSLQIEHKSHRLVAMRLFGIIITLSQTVFEVFTDIFDRDVPVDGAITVKEIAVKHALEEGTAYQRIFKLKTVLDAHRKGLGRCIRRVNIGRRYGYLFDEAEFRKAIGIK